MTTVRELDAIVRAGRYLDTAIAECSVEGLRALCDRYGVTGHTTRNREELERRVRRHVIGLHKTNDARGAKRPVVVGDDPQAGG